MSLIGEIVSTPDVEDAITATIVLWADEYLGDFEEQHDQSRNTISRPASYNETFDVDNWSEGQLPSVSVICPGTVGDLEHASGGDVNAWFEATISVMVSGQDERDARRVAGFYQSALATLLEQQGSLRANADTPFAQATHVIGTELRLPDADNRTLAVGNVTIRTFVTGIFNRFDGPAGPPPTYPVGDWPIAETVDIKYTAAQSLPSVG